MDDFGSVITGARLCARLLRLPFCADVTLRTRRTLPGREAYVRASRRWAACHVAELGQEVTWSTLRCSAMGPDTVLVTWEARWLPEAMMPLVRFGRCVRVCRRLLAVRGCFAGLCA